MAYKKNKNPNSTVRHRRFGSDTPARKIIISVIGIAMLTVILFTIYGFIATPEFLLKKKIESIVSDYYENYFYNAILDNNSINLKDASAYSASPAIAKILEKYVDSGFPETSLRTVLLSNNLKHADKMSSIEKYCNLDQTMIKIYPEPSFGNKNFHVNYTYSCKF